MYVDSMHACCLGDAEEGVSFPGTGITDDHAVSARVVLETKSGQEQQVLITVVLSLQAPHVSIL